MIDEITLQTARALLEIKAVHFNSREPFTLTSGRVSPVYVDCRKVISYPQARDIIIDCATRLLDREVGLNNFDCIAGGETAGIPYAAFLAGALNKPMQYVRKKPKGFGRCAQIEGDLAEGSKVLLVEDLLTDGGSKVGFIEALRTAGAEVADLFVVFHYGIFEQSKQTMDSLGVNIHQLVTWHDMLAVARELGTFDEETLGEVESFLKDPEAWSKLHGGEEKAG